MNLVWNMLFLCKALFGIVIQYYCKLASKPVLEGERSMSHACTVHMPGMAQIPHFIYVTQYIVK